MTSITALRNGDAVPHFVVRAGEGRVVEYSAIWQRRNLVLVAVPSSARADPYVATLQSRAAAFDEHESSVVVTEDRIPGLPAPGLLVADRWGEIVHLVTPQAVSDLPPAATLLRWLEAIEHRCPECEGEAK
jgi:hypothetical protein